MSLATGELCHFLFFHGVQASLLEDGCGVDSYGVDGCEGVHEVSDGEAAEHAAILECGADDSPFDGVGGVDSVDGNGSAGWLVESDNEINECGFSSTVRAEKCDDVAGVDG